jgi:hypothetical protein
MKKKGQKAPFFVPKSHEVTEKYRETTKRSLLLF